MQIILKCMYIENSKSRLLIFKKQTMHNMKQQKICHGNIKIFVHCSFVSPIYNGRQDRCFFVQAWSLNWTQGF